MGRHPSVLLGTVHRVRLLKEVVSVPIDLHSRLLRFFFHYFARNGAAYRQLFVATCWSSSWGGIGRLGISRFSICGLRVGRLRVSGLRIRWFGSVCWFCSVFGRIWRLCVWRLGTISWLRCLPLQCCISGLALQSCVYRSLGAGCARKSSVHDSCRRARRRLRHILRTHTG